jgi:hypothetical protein
VIYFTVVKHDVSPFDGHTDVEFTVESGRDTASAFSASVRNEDLPMYPIGSRHAMFKLFS